MKIVWLSHSAGIGGAELCIAEAAKGLAVRGHEVHVIVPRRGELIPLLEAGGASISVTPIPVWVHSVSRRAEFARSLARLIWHTFNQIRAYPGLFAVVSRARPDVIITNTITTGAGAAVARQIGVPHVWYIHELGFAHHGIAFDYGPFFSYRFISCLSSAVIVPTLTVLEEYRRHLPLDKLHRVRCAAVNEAPGTNVSPERESIGLIVVGQLTTGKRQEDAIRALAVLRSRGINASLTLVGGDPVGHGECLRRLVRDLGLETSVDMPGFTSTPRDYLARADVLLSCSSDEAFGRVVIEAMKAGTPVVGAASGATGEQIQDGWNGLLYRCGDAEDLADKIALLDADRELLAEMGRNGQAWATETFTIDNYARDLLDVLNAVVDRNTRGA